MFSSSREKKREMIQTKKIAPAELPPGWQWHYRDQRNRSFIAEKPGHDLRSPGFPDEAAAAHWAQLKEERRSARLRRALTNAPLGLRSGFAISARPFE